MSRVLFASQKSLCTFESLEDRRLLSAVLRPDKIVVVIEQDRACDAIGNPVMPYFNQLAQSGLFFSNYHGITHPSQPNMLALYSGSTQGVTQNWGNYSFPTQANLAKSLFDAGFSFSGFVENLPSDGSQVLTAGDKNYSDLYTRFTNPMAMFGNIGINPATGQARPNSAVNRTFGAFSSIPKNNYSSLPNVSFVIPNNLNSTHGSNVAAPWAGSADETNNDILRARADTWLKDNIDPYLQWAKDNNSLLIVIGDEERWVGGTSDSVTTIVNGDPDLFVQGTNNTFYNHFNLLRTITDMYGIAPLGQAANVSGFGVDAQGRLSPTTTQQQTNTQLVASRTSSVFGQSITFTATVSAGAGTPGGTVFFKRGDTTLGSAVLNAGGQASLTISNLGVGGSAITAVYTGAAGFAPSTSAAVNITVAKASSSVSLVSAPNPSALGAGVRFTATVSPVAPGAGAPTGSVQFLVDGQNFGAPVSLVNGVATSPAIDSMTVGNHTITAVYSGDANFAAAPVASVGHTVVALTNNDFANGTVIEGTNLTLSSSNTGATKENKEPNHAGNAGGKSVWWTWTAPANGSLTLDTLGSSFDTLLAAYTGNAVDALTQRAANDDAPGGGTLTSRIGFAVTAGTTYHIAVDGYNRAAGDITLRLVFSTQAPTPAPANDNFEGAPAIPSSGGTVTGTNAAATRQSGELWHVGNRGGRSVWWTWTAPRNGVVTLDTVGSTFDTLLGVYTGTIVSSLTTIASNDDAPNTTTSRVTFNAVSGTTYRIAVDGYDGATGNITLNLTLV